MPRVRNTPRRPRCRPAKNGDRPDLGGAERPPESPSPGQSRPGREKSQPGPKIPRPGQGASASPGERAAACPESASSGRREPRRARPGESASVAAAAHHAPHLAQRSQASAGQSGGRRAHANSGEAGSIPALAPQTTGPEFVDAVFAQVNPVEVSCGLLQSNDERIREKHLDRLLELKYGKPTAAPPFELPTVVADLPRPDHSEREPSE